jgi:hypothetical protein
VAIFFDLIFGLVFELISTVIALAVRIVILAVQLAVQILKVHWRILVSVMTLLVYILTLPFALLHEAVDRLRSGSPSSRTEPESRPASTGKPEWAFSREV